MGLRKRKVQYLLWRQVKVLQQKIIELTGNPPMTEDRAPKPTHDARHIKRAHSTRGISMVV